MGMKEVRYGYLYGARTIVSCDIAASQAFKNLSGKFVKLDSSENAEIAGSGDQQVFGWLDIGEITSSTTAGQDKAGVDISYGSVYRIPADAAVTKDLVGKTCDLITASDIQKADIGESTEDPIQIVAVSVEDIANQTVQVRRNPYPANAPSGVV